MKALLRVLLRLVWRVEVAGFERFAKAGPRAVIVVNHVSFLDAVLVTAFLPETPVFAVNTVIARRWWMKFALLFFDLLALDPTNPLAARKLVQVVREGRKCAIFPEGRITVTGALMKIYEGPGMIADLADATIVPIRIDGAQYTPFSRLKGKVRRRLFPKITVTMLEPRRFEVDAALKGRRRRAAIGAKLYDAMTEMIFETSEVDRTLFESLLDAGRIHGRRHPIVEDIERRPLTYDRLIAASFTLGRRLARHARPGGAVGVLLPNSVAAVATFFALHAHGRVPAMLNFSTGLANMRLALRAARVSAVVTSRRFVEAARLEDVVKGLGEVAEIVYLEDVRRHIGVLSKLYGLIAARLARFGFHRAAAGVKSGDPAVILFTSGSEGVPKGVALSHRNIQANRHQLSARIDFNPSDIVFNALPIFHSFGLTGGLLLPLLSGVRTFLYPSPLHYRIVPALVYDSDATILFGTDTFLSGYARAAHPYDFYSVRYVFAGAEKLKAETSRTFSEKFGLRILEGYGATETAPVIAVNTPMQHRSGTVGRLLPGLRHRLAAVPGIERGGRLEVAGSNVMLGYLRPDRPGEIAPLDQGWYDTGDIVEIDGEGYVTILGRVKRFAKIAGEMVSLAAVEDHVHCLWPGSLHAVVSVPDARKGERLVLVTDFKGSTREALGSHIQRHGGSELMVPKAILTVDKVPLLGTGKIDYPGVTALVQSRLPGGEIHPPVG